MVATNGHALNSRVLHCDSDYPVIDMVPFVPSAPKPGWKDQHAAFTHHIQWLDAEGISHGLTLRSDSLTDLMRDLRLLKSMIKQAREQHSNNAVANDPCQPEEESLTKPCELHSGSLMKRRTSKAGHCFYSHRLPDGSWCNGKAKA